MECRGCKEVGDRCAEGQRRQDGSFCPMRENAPYTREGALAWTLANQPALWSQTAIAGISQSLLVTQGLRIDAALTVALSQYPDIDQLYLIICLQAIEVSRLDVEARMRNAKSQEAA